MQENTMTKLSTLTVLARSVVCALRGFVTIPEVTLAQTRRGILARFAAWRDGRVILSGRSYGDDTGLLQGALDACPQGSGVLLAPGVFRLSGAIVKPRGVSVYGCGRSTVLHRVTTGV